ncbi:hypothetical protein ACHAO9_007916 [Fusarium lateritium]
MDRANPRCQSADDRKRLFPCVVGHKFPDKCNKSFPSIEKHNAHIKRFHSPHFWCNDCFWKFNSSLSDRMLQLAKKEHEAMCLKQPSSKGRALREESYIIDEALYKRFWKREWKQTPVPYMFKEGRWKESIPQRSWRQILEMIFPSTIAAVEDKSDNLAHFTLHVDATRNLLAGLERLDVSSRSQAAKPLPGFVPLPSDSGYESMQKGIELKPSLSCVPEDSPWNNGGNNVENLQNATHHLPDDAADKAPTLYTDGLSLPDDDQDIYKSEFAEALFNHILENDAAIESFDPLKEALPDLLRSFALRLGSPSSTKEDKEVMWFIHNDIARRFQNATEDKECSEDVLENKEPFDKLEISDWLCDLTTEGYPEAESSGATYEEELEEHPSPLDQKGYREAIFNSVAYRWLVDALVKVLTMEAIQEDFGLGLRREISRYLELDRSISKSEASKQYTTVFVANWNPAAYLREQFEEPCDLERLLGETITLTGSATDAQALPCTAYLHQAWPATGITLLSLLRAALVSGKNVSGQLPDKTVINCHFRDSKLEVEVKGISDSIVTIGEQIGWLGASLRSSCLESGMATCCPQVHFSQPLVEPLRCTIEYPVALIAGKPELHGDGTCWYAIFRNPVIATGFPIPKRKRYGSGLEVPLNVMAGLTMSPRIHNYKGRSFFKGYSTALVATDTIGDMVLWHFYYSPKGDHLPYPDLDDTDYPDLNRQDLIRARHVVGWCSQAKFHAGAPGMNYNIGVSQLNEPGRDFSLEKVSFSVGQLVTAGCQFAIGRKDRHVNATRGTYKDKLEWLDWNYVTLWDIDAKRGWLINGTAALLHLLRASLEHCSTDKFKCEFLFDPNEFQESEGPHSMQSVIDVLLNPTNRKLKLYIKDEESHEERRLSPDGQLHVETKTIITYKRIQDRIEELYETLEKLIDHTVSAASSFKGINAKKLPHDYLEGWDFADIAKSRDPFVLKKTNLSLSLMGWGDMTRAIPSITLFGKGFGDMIVASRLGTDNGPTKCSEWETVPKGKNLLCVRNWDLRDIIKRMGSQTTMPITVVPGLVWKSPLPASPFGSSCTCELVVTKNRNPSHHAIQHLVPMKQLANSNTVIDLESHIDGAVIFGPWKQWENPWRSPIVVESSGNTDIGNSDTSQPTTSYSRSITPSATASNGSESQSSNLPVTTGDGEPGADSTLLSHTPEVSQVSNSGSRSEILMPDSSDRQNTANISLPDRVKRKASELLESYDEPGIFRLRGSLLKRSKRN